MASAPTGPGDPGLQFYSALNGSGGNVTWNVTLPVDRNATANQSDLYNAVWFGMTVTAPTAWMNQCFLELQLYPDATWFGTGSQNGNWIGAVVAWQIQASTGAEDPCFYDPLYANGIPGTDFLNMSQGDRINVAMSGWPGNTTGELLTVHDLTNGNRSYVIAYNASGSFPLDPAYTANDFPDALQWSSGGDYPVVFGVVAGTAGNPTVPSNNSYGGCSPGLPPSTVSNPSVPCPSFNPGSWVNDTLHPWQITPPTFFNATSRSGPPAQVAFSQAFGGIETVSSLAGGACAGRLGSAYCSYPWFSYSCALGAFEFGATDYPGVSSDFGQFSQYSTTVQYDAAQLPFYAPQSFSVPSCNNPGYTVTVAPAGAGGSVELLNQVYHKLTTIIGLVAGSYLAQATPPTGEYFSDWTTTGSIVVELPHSPWSTVTITGNGSLYAIYSASATLVAVTFADSPSGEVAVSPGWLVNTLGTVRTVPANGVLELTPGTYSILAYPPQGFVFSGWSLSGSGQRVAASNLPLTWLVVTGGAAADEVFASYSTSVAFDRIVLAAYDPANATYGGGTVSFGGFLTTTSKMTSGRIAVGTYSLSATPSAGFQFGGWSYTRSSIMLNFSPTTNVTLENGTVAASIPSGNVTAIFLATPVVITFNSAEGSGGVVVAGYGYVRAGGTLSLTPGLNYSLSAAPSGGLRFVTWSPTHSSVIWNRAPGSWSESLVVNQSGIVVANYGVAGTSVLTFQTAPTTAGRISFNGNDSYSNDGTNSSVVAGETYLDSAVALSGFVFSQWSTTGSVKVGTATFVNSSVTVSGSGTLIATFVPLNFPVTVVTNTPQPVGWTIDGVAVTIGSNIELTPGTHAISVSVSASATFVAWSATPNLAVSVAESNQTALTVSGPGTLTALIAPFAVATPSVTPGVVDLGIPVRYLSTMPAGGSYTVQWNGLPPGCPGATFLTFSCIPGIWGLFTATVTFTDLWGESGTSHYVSLFVNSLPILSSVNLSLAAVDVGIPTNITSAVVGGTGPFTWIYGGLPSGCASADQNPLACTPNVSGTFNVAVNMTDLYGVLVQGSVLLVVNPLPSLVLTASSNSIAVGDSVTFQYVLSGGTGPAPVNVTGLPPGCLWTVGSSLSCRPTAAGTYTVTVSARDAFGKTASQAVTLLVTPPSTLASGLTTTEFALGLGVLLAIAVITFVALRRRPKSPTIVATPKAPPVRRVPPPAPSREIPEWSETPPPPQEWHEGR